MKSRYLLLSLTFALACSSEKPPATSTPPPPPIAQEDPAATDDPPETPTDAPPPAPAPADSGGVSGGAACLKQECGPAMGMPNWQCADGSGIGGPRCVRKADGKCGWEVNQCPQ